MRQNEDAVAGMMSSGAIGYTSALTEHVISDAQGSDVIVDQYANPDTDVITGLPFSTGEEEELSLDEIKSEVDNYISMLNTPTPPSSTSPSSPLPRTLISTTARGAAVSGLTREDIEEMMVSGYAEEMGVDADSVRDYINQMDDETLMSYVREMVRETVANQYAEAVTQQLSALSQEQLAWR